MNMGPLYDYYHCYNRKDRQEIAATIFHLSSQP
jgi:hypothetical protein